MLLGILAFIGLIVLWVIFGLTWELFKCYFNKKENEDLEGSEDGNDYEMDNNTANRKNNNKEGEEEEPTNCRKFSIYIGLILLGIILQPAYLVFKMLEFLMELYRQMGCWLYIMAA